MLPKVADRAAHARDTLLELEARVSQAERGVDLVVIGQTEQLAHSGLRLQADATNRVRRVPLASSLRRGLQAQDRAT